MFVEATTESFFQKIVFVQVSNALTLFCLGLIWHHADKGWWNHCPGICQIPDIYSVLLPHVCGNCPVWGTSRACLPASPSQHIR